MNHFQKCRTVLKELYDNQELVNCTILTEDGGVFKVHIEILAGISPYFKRIVTNSRDTPWDNIYLPNVSKEIMANIINYIYTGDLCLALDKVNALCRAAEMLQMPSIIQLCKTFLLMKLNNETCVSIYMFAKYFQYEDLKDKARSYIMAHFQEIFPTSADFLNLEADDLVTILSSDNLNVKSEHLVFSAVNRWVDSEPQMRAVYLPSLLRCIRLALLDYQFYETNIWSNPHISTNEECQSILYQASQVFAEMNNGDPRQSLFDLHHPFLRPRIPYEIIFVMGGWSAGSATNIMETLDVKSERWYLALIADSVPRAYHGMLWHQSKIYVIGGFDGNQCFNSVRRFDPVTHIWEERGCMHVQRCYVSVAKVDDYIYAMGGYDGHRRNKSCERYNPESNQWSYISNMNHIRSDASADSLDGKIYIAGGFNGSQVLESAECYDPETDEWTLITTMNSPRSGVKLVAYCDVLYVIGGFNGNNRLATVEKYDLRAKMWFPVASMNGPRSNFATAVINGHLYVIGGFNGLSTISTVEYYDCQTNNWENAPDLNLNRSALAACSVSGISTASEYSFHGNVPQP
ncbi:kelch-like protein 10 isoform X1 [Stegodyphus dumicola]|uniref:kelch-like protein 10 isoform X1 n=1 Tax=Stegodyphus dumicola TaxID=202533 RepID=UPI0015B29203|nr:kelch-like protein 10 isoform X1 [Stegodyphus dumicola]